MEGLDKAMFTRAEVAEILKVSVPTLKRWASKGTGPDYCVLEGSVRYPADWLNDWTTARERAA
jgi:predicted site-specific integrase-resolvase